MCHPTPHLAVPTSPWCYNQPQMSTSHQRNTSTREHTVDAPSSAKSSGIKLLSLIECVYVVYSFCITLTRCIQYSNPV